MGMNTAATGGVEAAPSPHGVAMGPSMTPDDTPNLLDPTMRPDEPITAGLPVGPGPGPAETPAVKKSNDLQVVKQYLPDLEEAARWEDAPASFKHLVNMIRNS
jgi:hypothetical protein